MAKSILLVSVLAVFTAAGARAAGNASQAECRSYANSAVSREKRNQAFGCKFAGPQWSASFEYHYKWCVGGRTQEELAQQTRDRSRELNECERNRNKTAAARAKSQTAKGPTKQACQSAMTAYDRDMKSWNAAQAECQKLAAAHKPTSVVYNRYLASCNAQDAVGRRFLAMGCDKAFPDMPAPGRGPNQCVQQVKANCPRIAK